MQNYTMSEEEKKYLEQYDISAYERPSVAADMAIFAIREAAEAENFRKLPKKALKLLLIRRADYPYKGYWALPGGFCRRTEDVQETAERELYEETNIQKAYLNLIGTFGGANRDPRGWIISNTFLALVDAERCKPRAGTDAWEAKWFTVEVKGEELKRDVKEDYAELETSYELWLTEEESGEGIFAKVKEYRQFREYHETVRYEIVEQGQLAFDHAKIILYAWQKLREDVESDSRHVFDLMPELFTLNQLQNAMELVTGQELLTANFRRKIADYVVETDMVTDGKGHRPAKLYSRNIKAFYK